MERFLWICLAGAVGTSARYLMGGWILRLTGPVFPWGTLTINFLGSFLIGAILEVALAVEGFPPTFRFALTTGLMARRSQSSLDQTEPLLALLDEMVPKGLVTVGRVRIVKYAAGDRRIATGEAP